MQIRKKWLQHAAISQTSKTPQTPVLFCVGPWFSRFQTGRNQGNFDLNLSIAFYPCVDLSFAHRLKEENSTDRAFRLAGHHSVLPHHRSGTRHFPGTGSMQLSPTWRSIQVVTNILQDMVYVYIYIDISPSEFPLGNGFTLARILDPFSTFLKYHFSGYAYVVVWVGGSK